MLPAALGNTAEFGVGLKTVYRINNSYDSYNYSFEFIKRLFTRGVDLLVKDDDNALLRELGISGKILYTPGHCVDHLVIVLDDGTTFCGDAASSFPLLAGIKYSTLFITNMEQSYQSWQKMIDEESSVIYPSHGKPFNVSKLKKNKGKIKTSDLVKFF